MTRSPRPWLEAAGVVLVAAALVAFAARNVGLQWDLELYRAAAMAVARGFNPYDASEVHAATGRVVLLPFVYPPIALLPFLPLAAMSEAVAKTIWSLLKLALLGILVVLWSRLCARRVSLFALVLASVFGFGAAALWDLRAGNVAILEAFLLWAGLLCFATDRRVAFALLIMAAALFKLVPAALLILLLVPAGRSPARPRLFVAAMVALFALIWGPLVLGPAASWDGFLRNVPSDALAPRTNPSALTLATSFLKGLDPAFAPRPAQAVTILGAYFVLLALASARWLRASWRARDARRWSMGAAMLLVLVTPRPMAYGYLNAVAPVLALTPRPLAGPGGLVVAAIVSIQGIAWAVGASMPPWLEYLPFLLALGFWLVIVSRPAQDGSP